MEQAIKKFYSQLVKMLPMDDAYFRSMLFSADLLPGNLKDEVQSKPTRADRAEYFLDQGVKNHVKNFLKLIEVLEKSEHDNLIDLAKQIRNEIDISTQPSPKKIQLESSAVAPAIGSPIHSSTLDKIKERLKVIYGPSPDSDEPHCYIQLALVKDGIISRNDEKLNEITKLTLQGQVDEITQMKESLNGIKDIFYYKDSTCPRIILIIGAPGIGKTTLAEEICRNWTRGCGFLADDYDLLLSIPLCYVQEKTLEEMIIEYVGGKEAYEVMNKSHGLRCLIILEGLDEVTAKWQQDDETFKQLVIRRTLLENATILITSRPHACITLYEDVKRTARRIEIIGFNKEEIKNYVSCNLDSIEEATKFMEELDNFPHIKSLCYVPLSLKMIVEIYQCTNHCFFDTLTELHKVFLLMKIKENLKHKKPVPLGRVSNNIERKLIEKLPLLFDNFPEEALETIFLLSKLAYHSFFDWYDIQNINYREVMNPKIVYTSKELLHCNITVNPESDGLGILKATHTRLLNENIMYSFNHLAVEEFFCAIYISLLPEQKQLHLITDSFNKCPHMWPFFAGITKLKSRHLSGYFYKVASPIMDHDKKDPSFVTTLSCIYEAQLSDPFLKNPELLPIHYSGAGESSLLPYHCMAISFYMLVATIACLNIPHCSIGDQGVKMLTRYNNSKASLEVVNLIGNSFTCKGLNQILNEVGNKITHLLLSGNTVSDDGISDLVSLPVQSKLQHLIELDIMEIKMSATGAFALSKFLKSTKSMKFLNISYNDIGDNGIKAIADSLKVNNSISQLIASRCEITCNGAVSISDMLKNNRTLITLSIFYNPIGDNGVTTMVDALLTNDKLKKLDLRYCNLGDDGTKSLVKLLHTNKCLNKLDIMQNQSISADVIGDLLQAAVNNCVIDDLQVDYNKLDWRKWILMDKLADKRNQKSQHTFKRRSCFEDTVNVLDNKEDYEQFTSPFNVYDKGLYSYSPIGSYRNITASKKQFNHKYKAKYFKFLL